MTTPKTAGITRKTAVHSQRGCSSHRGHHCKAANYREACGMYGGVSGLLSYIQLHPGQRSIEIVDALNTSLRTTERWLKQLKDEGKTEFRGSPKTGGYYSKVDE